MKAFFITLTTVLISAAAFCAGTVNVKAADINPVNYSYSVYPVADNFNYCLYVKTDNPDPSSFRFVDRSSVYISGEYSDQGVIQNVTGCFADVVYEDTKTARVKGGYIFDDINEDSDGGTLILQRKSGNTYVDTSITVNCPRLYKPEDYLIDYYTNSGMSFFEKLDNVQSALNNLSVYPYYVLDNISSAERYPSLYYNPNRDYNGLMANTAVYDPYADGILMEYSYPFILDSASFPGMMRTVAKKLDPECEVVRDSYYHELVNITKNGETRSYGGQGNGGNNPAMLDSISKVFKFDNSSSDLFGKQSSDLVRENLKIKDQAEAEASKYRDLVRGETFRKKIGSGSWIRIENGKYAFVAPFYSGTTKDISDAWVDGRFINEWEYWESGARYEDHPNADIVIRDMEYTDKNGVKHKNDVWFIYKSSTDTWSAANYYVDSYIYPSSMQLPSEFILTRAQVNSMNVDKNTNVEPKKGLIYDGSVEPGTPFNDVVVSSVTINKSLTLEQGKSKTLKATVKPADAENKKVTWSSSDPSVAAVDSNGKVTAKKVGTAKITATTVNGKTAVCEVKVNFLDVTNPNDWYYKPVYWAVDKGIVTGSNGYFYHAKDCTREQAITMLWRLAGQPVPKSLKSNFSDVKNTKSYSYKAILWGNEQGLILGKKGKFNPGGTCTREQIVTMIWRMAGKPEPKSTTSKFSDVTNKNSYSYKAVLWANEQGIAKGSNGEFLPTAKCKRRDIVTFIYRFAKLK